MRYIEMIERARKVGRIETEITTGDVDYPGTAMEVRDETGEELFHVVVDSHGERQVLFLVQKENYRLQLAELEEIIRRAQEEVRFAAEP